MLYVYALLAEAPGATLGRGLGGERLHLVEMEGVRVVAGTLPAVPRPSLPALRRHDAVVRRLAKVTDAVLPVRFGTALTGRAALARALAGQGPALRRALRVVRGREQMTLRVFGVPAPSPRPRAVPDGRPGTRYLAARLAAAVHRTTVPELRMLRRRLAPLVRAERVERHDAPPLLATVYHLVDRGRSAEYLATLDRAVAAPGHRVRVRASGPWPAYGFVPEPAA